MTRYCATSGVGENMIQGGGGRRVVRGQDSSMAVGRVTAVTQGSVSFGGAGTLKWGFKLSNVQVQIQGHCDTGRVLSAVSCTVHCDGKAESVSLCEYVVFAFGPTFLLGVRWVARRASFHANSCRLLESGSLSCWCGHFRLGEGVLFVHFCCFGFSHSDPVWPLVGGHRVLTVLCYNCAGVPVSAILVT